MQNNPPHPGKAIQERMGPGKPIQDLIDLKFKTDLAIPYLKSLLTGNGPITELAARKLSFAFPDTSREYWINLQQTYNQANP